MNRPDSRVNCDWVRSRVEQFVDDQLAAGEVFQLRTHVSGCIHCESDLKLAVSVRGSLRDMPTFSCPESVGLRLISHILRRQLLRLLPGWPIWRWRPLIVPASVVVALALVLRLHPGVGGGMDAEVSRARIEVEWTVGFLGELGRRTGLAVRDRVIDTHVIQPIQSRIGEFIPN